MILNKQQEKVVRSKEQHIFLLAGAGSGKTRVVIERIKYLLQNNIAPSAILAITFTHKASVEMQERLNTRSVAIHTFHQFAFQYLRAYTIYPYKIIDEQKLPYNEKELLDISLYKNHFYQIKKPKAFDAYQLYLAKHRLKDFDDLLIDLLNTLKQKIIKINFQYIFVDEFQDTNELQYLILKEMIHQKTYVLAVGDPDQSIYQFRGANSKIIERYIKDYQAKVEVLDMNYRSTPKIINISNQFIQQNIRKLKKTLMPVNQENYEIKKLIFESLELEAEFIIQTYKTFINQGSMPNEIAVLYRNHQRSYVLKNMLNQYFIDDEIHIQLLTMHQAKGLEFDVVFIIGLEEGECPSYHTDTYDTLEEERRLMYVAMTRAKKYLYLTYTKNTGQYKRKSKFFKNVKL